MRNGSERGTESIGSAGDGYTRCRSPQLVVGGSLGLDRAHGVGAGERRQRRTLVQSDGQGDGAGDAGGGLGQSSGQWRRCRDALREVAQLIEAGHTFVVDADFESYFDTIAHDRLMQRVEERVSDGRLLDLLRGWLKQDILCDLQRWTPTEGTPQGAVISPLMANIYLHPLDELMAARGYRMVRYADDFVVLCKSREQAAAALAEIRAWVADNGLRLHPNKTHVGDCLRAGQGFEFLGYRFEAGRRFVRKKSLTRLKDNIRARTRRTRGQSLARIIDGLNSVLKGWFAYFKHAHPRTFIPIDKFIRRRLRSILLKQTKKQSGFGLSRATHQRWPNAFFAQAGLLALHTAWLTARHSR